METGAEKRAGRAAVRPFDGRRDFAALARLVGDEWHTYLPAGPAREAAGGFDLAGAAAVSTLAFVAEVDGEAAGVCMACAGEEPEAAARRGARWSKVGARCLAGLGDQDARAVVERLGRESEANDALLRRAGVRTGGEVVLLVLNGRLRGRGLGGRLFDAALDGIARTGARSAHLFTDSSCTWQLYEARGLWRAASAPSPHTPGREQYLYVADLAGRPASPEDAAPGR